MWEGCTFVVNQWYHWNSSSGIVDCVLNPVGLYSYSKACCKPSTDTRARCGTLSHGCMYPIIVLKTREISTCARPHAIVLTQWGCNVIYHYSYRRGFMKYHRQRKPYRPAETRLKDWGEIYNHQVVKKELKMQAARYEIGLPIIAKTNWAINWLVRHAEFYSQKVIFGLSIANDGSFLRGKICWKAALCIRLFIYVKKL